MSDSLRVSDEAVEAAVQAFDDEVTRQLASDDIEGQFRDTLRAALEAAQPFMECSVTRRRSTYSMPGSSGHDDFRAKQEPQFEPVDDLSRFVLDRIREAETEPVADQVEPNGQPMAYRYASYVRRDMVAFRRIAAEYCEWMADRDAARKHGAGDLWMAHRDGLLGAMTAIANRWDDHHDFEEGWLLDG